MSEKKWFSGELQLCPHVRAPGGCKNGVCKCLVQCGVSGRIEISLMDVKNEISLLHLRWRTVRVYGRILPAPADSSCKFILETEKIVHEREKLKVPRSCCTSKSVITGRLQCLSPLLENNNEDEPQNEVYLEMEMQSDHGKALVYIVLIGSAVALLPYLNLNKYYSISTASSGKHQWFGKSPCYVIQDPESFCDCENNLATSRKVLDIGLIATEHSSLYRPICTLDREMLMHKEIDIQGEFFKWSYISKSPLSPSTAACFMELTGGYKKLLSPSDKYLLCLPLRRDLIPAGLLRLWPSMRRGAVIEVRNVLPLYLWSRLHGFAITPRSQIVICMFSTIMGTVDEEAAKVRSSVCTMPSGNCYPTKCLFFTAWISYVHRRIMQSITSSSFRSLFSSLTKLRTVLEHNISFSRCNFDIPLKEIIDRTGGMSTVFDRHIGPLFIARACMDSDHILSVLPEFWSVSMLKQFGENMLIRFKKKDDSGSNTRLCVSLVSLTRFSSLRFETASSRHDILLVGTVEDILIPPDGDTLGPWCIVVRDRRGSAMTLVVSPEEATRQPSCRCSESAVGDADKCKDSCYKFVMKHWLKSRQAGLLLIAKNPIVFTEILPHFNDQGSSMVSVVQGSDLWVHCEETLAPCSAFDSDNKSLPSSSSSFAPSRYLLRVAETLSSRLDPIGDDSFVQSPEPGSGLRITSRVLSVREALMLETFGVKSGQSLVNISGVVIGKEILDDKRCSAWARKGDCQRQKLQQRKCLIIIKDLEFGDIIYCYMPLLHADFAPCLQHFIIVVWNVKLRASSNNRRIYLEYACNESSLGVAGVLSYAQIQKLANVHCESESSPHKMLTFKERVDKTGNIWHRRNSYPSTTITKLYQSHKRNRCIWKLKGKFLLVKSVTIHMRCKLCLTGAGLARNNNAEKHKCDNRACRNSMVASADSFQVWWKGTLVFDDGSGEAQVFMEGEAILSTLEALSKNNVESFSTVRKSIEAFVITVHWPLSYNFNNVVASEDYHYAEDCTTVCSEVVPGILPPSSHRRNQQAEQPRNFNRHEHLQRQRLIDRIHKLLHPSKLALPLFQVLVKIVFNDSGEAIPRSLTNPEVSVCDKVKHGGFTRRVKVQSSRVPPWNVDNVELPSMALSTMVLDCLHLEEMGTMDCRLHCWDLLNKMKS